NEDRTLRHILNVLSEKASPYFCGDSLTVKQRKPLAKHIFQQNMNLESAWPSTVDLNERHETIANSFLTFWSMYDASSNADVPSEANLYAKPRRHMKWLHFIKQEMEKKKFIQEMKPQGKASISYVHRKLQKLPFVKKLNTSKYRLLKKNILITINSNKTLEILIKRISMLFKPLSKQYKTRPSCFSNTLALEDQDTFLYFPCTRLIPRVYRLTLKSFGDLPSNVNKIKPSQKNDNDLTLWYFNVFDFSKIGYKTLESLTSRLKKLAYTVAIQDEPRREPKTPKDSADSVDDAEIWAADPGIPSIFTAVDSTEHKRIRTTTARNMAHQAQLALKTKPQTKANMYLYPLLSSLPPLNINGLLRLEMVLLVQV
ncbi:hypothetical protein BCV72DRAFT_314262, partial [Rhizopus microsporus var. microsporus]